MTVSDFTISTNFLYMKRSIIVLNQNWKAIQDEDIDEKVQMVEQRTVELKVLVSNPAAGEL